MLIEIRDENDRTTVDFKGEFAEKILPLILKAEGERRVAVYKNGIGTCNQIVIDVPTKLSFTVVEGKDVCVFLWKGYKINYKA